MVSAARIILAGLTIGGTHPPPPPPPFSFFTIVGIQASALVHSDRWVQWVPLLGGAGCSRRPNVKDFGIKCRCTGFNYYTQHLHFIYYRQECMPVCPYALMPLCPVPYARMPLCPCALCPYALMPCALCPCALLPVCPYVLVSFCALMPLCPYARSLMPL